MRTIDELWKELIDEDTTGEVAVADKVGELIATLVLSRIDQRITQKELAEKVGLTQSAIARFESIRTYPRIDTLIKIAHALGHTLTFEEKKTVKMPVVEDVDFNMTEYDAQATPYIFEEAA